VTRGAAPAHASAASATKPSPSPALDRPDARGRQAGQRRLVRPVLLAVAVGVAGNTLFVLLTADRAVLAALGRVDLRCLALAMGLALVPWFTNTVRTTVWLRFVGHPITPRETLHLILAGELGSAVTPTAAGGGCLKAGMMMARGVRPGTAASLLILGSLEDAVFVALALPIALVVSGSWSLPILHQAVRAIGARVWLLGALVAGVLLLALVWRRHGRRGGRPSALGRAWGDFAAVYPRIAERGKARFAGTLALTAAQWICRHSVLTALFASAGIPADPVQIFLLQWLVFALTAVVPTPGGAGAAEAGFFLVYASLVPEGLLPVLAAGWRFVTFYALLLLGAGVCVVIDAWQHDGRRSPATGRWMPAIPGAADSPP
jgi:glycosyltransferase 2 family protein